MNPELQSPTDNLPSFKTYQCRNNHVASAVYIRGTKIKQDVQIVIEDLRQSCTAIIRATRMSGVTRESLRHRILLEGENIINSLLSMSVRAIPLASRYTYLAMLVTVNETI